MKQLFRNLTIVALLAILFLSCGQKHNLVAEIDGIGNDTILISYVPVSQFDYFYRDKLQDTIYATNNKFVYDSPIKEPVYMTLFPKKGTFTKLDGSPRYPIPKHVTLLLKPEDKISVHGKLGEYYLEYTAKGSEFNEEFSRVRSTYIERFSETHKLDMKIDSLITKGTAVPHLMDSLFSKRSGIVAETFDIKTKYALNNLDKDLSALYLSQGPANSFLDYYSEISENVKEGVFKNLIEGSKVRARKDALWREALNSVKVGDVAQDFTLKSIDGAKVSLSSIDKEYIVLDFWGSWCGPCKRGMPKMKEYYNKYKGKYEVIGIAVRDKEKNWRACVEEFELPWINLFNDEHIDRDVNMKYGIKAYPTKIILDKDRKIIVRIEGESEEFYQKLDELFSK